MIKLNNVFITISYAATGLYRENAEDRLLQGGNVSPVVPGAPGSQPGAFLPSVSSNYLFTQSHIVVDHLPPHLSVFSKPFFLQEGSSSMQADGVPAVAVAADTGAQTMLAPMSVITNNRFVHVREQGQEYYIVSEGATLNNFFAANGPPEVTSYVWNKVRTPDTTLAVYATTIRIELGSTLATNKKHYLDDTHELTQLGRNQLAMSPNMEVFRMVFACKGAGSDRYKGSSKTNCELVCGFKGQGKCNCSEEQLRNHHACKVRAHVTRTLQNIQDKVAIVKIFNTHVPAGVTPRPPPPQSLRMDPVAGRHIYIHIYMQSCRVESSGDSRRRERQFRAHNCHLFYDKYIHTYMHQ